MKLILQKKDHYNIGIVLKVVKAKIMIIPQKKTNQKKTNPQKLILIFSNLNR